jgi:hypothetical protein
MFARARLSRSVFLQLATDSSHPPCFHSLKVYLFLVAATLQQAVAPPQYSPARPEKVTLLRVKASAFGGEQQVRVTADSIIVDKRTGEESTHYAQAITAAEHAHVVAPFNQVYLSRLKPSYEGQGAPTDAMGFELFIQKGEKVKKVWIYMAYLRPLYLFSNRLNLLLPPTYRLAYNKQYFTYKR